MKAVKGDDYQNKGQDHKTFGITITDAWINIRGELQPHGNMVEVYRTEAVRDRILTLLERHGFTDEPQAGAGGGVVVKPLEWRAVERTRSDEDPRTEETGDYEAASPVGEYFIECGFGSDSYVWSLSYNESFLSAHDDPETAKTAAQADYEARVLAALAPSPSAGERLDDAEKRIMQDYAWGNLTKLGVANHLRRAGFRMDIACDKANALATPPATPVQPTASVEAMRSAVVAALKQAASGGASGLADHEIDEIADDLLASLTPAPTQKVTKECDTCMNGFLATNNPCPDCGRVARRAWNER